MPNWWPIILSIFGVVFAALVIALILALVLKRWARHEKEKDLPLDLRGLRRQGVITEEEYKALRRKIADKMRETENRPS